MTPRRRANRRGPIAGMGEAAAAARRLVLATAMACCMAPGALAQTADGPGKAVPETAPEAGDAAPSAPAPPEAASDAVSDAARDVAARAAALAGEGSPSSAEAEALAAFYGGENASLLWAGEAGLLLRARAAADELARAGDWGLDPQVYAVPDLQAGTHDPARLARMELALTRAVLAYVRDAWGGRASDAKLGSQLSYPLTLPDPAAVLAALAEARDPGAYLRAQHPDHPQFAALRKELAALDQAGTANARTPIPAGRVLRRRDAHAWVALLRRRLGVEPKDDQHFDAALETALKAFQRERGLAADGILGDSTRAALNADTAQKRRYQLLINMERWRWLPRPLDNGAGIYVWANVPEFRVRVVANGKVVFNERVIAGKADKKTPVFSDRMEWIEIHPTWYVPNSIKVEDILPSLRRSSSRIMTRYHLRMDCGARGRDPAAIDWSSVDIRKCAFSQPPGEKSVLGDFKFKFPNHHDVYMHDTPTRRLFEANIRAFSHGCIRVSKPRRMAEILLAHDGGMSAARLEEILAGPKVLHKAVFNTPVPVHITYFTAFADDQGALVARPDYYGHDRRLAEALYGKGELFPEANMPGGRGASHGPPPRRKKKEWWERYMNN